MTTVRRTPTYTVTVVAARDLTARMRRITLAAPSLVGLSVTPAQDIELIFAEESGLRVKRRYTIRTARPAVGEVDVDVLIHPHGPGGRWAGSVAIGDEAQFLGPRGHLGLRPSSWHLFVGDEAGLPAIAALIEALPPTEDSVVLAEVTDSADEIALGSAAVTWLHRGADAPGGLARFAPALAELPARPDGRAYLFGESRAMVALRPAVEALGITADRSYVKGYWNLGRGARRIPSP